MNRFETRLGTLLACALLTLLLMFGGGCTAEVQPRDISELPLEELAGLVGQSTPLPKEMAQAIEAAGVQNDLQPKILNGITGPSRAIVGLKLFEGFCGPGCFRVAPCSGQLISRHFILTAAHCIDPSRWSGAKGIFNGFAQVNYHAPSDGSRHCLTRGRGEGSLLQCDENRGNDWAGVIALINPEYTGGPARA